jgi:hypothetical protein
MSPQVRKGLIVAVLHVAMVASLGAKMLADRTLRPHAWARVAPVDPDLPIRGRYVRMGIEGPADDSVQSTYDGYFLPIVRDDQLVFVPAGAHNGLYGDAQKRGNAYVVVLRERLAYFIPEHIPDPSRLAPGEQLWVEVTLPRRGAPRPIRLGVKRAGVLTPLDLD